MGRFWRCFFEFFYSTNRVGARATPWTETERTLRRTLPRPAMRALRTPGAKELEEARPHHRPDVSGYFTVALVCALASGFFLCADLLREQIGIGQILAFAAEDPMFYVLGSCVALLAVLLAVGDI
jgi:hypothetical protein